MVNRFDTKKFLNPFEIQSFEILSISRMIVDNINRLCLSHDFFPSDDHTTRRILILHEVRIHNHYDIS
ncbi:MAG: hypothetical protein ETSY1_18575 [Candidatus Entotheonella factor]|uniref:Uncharacterized protein n=1 Tax=Entotheonella factor TaxID=1429438 RepID=W4LKQ2_ENTF1|nr:MAG: hypothetical protein ETSY1_18575 [Candidatus Entotheonella factor]